MFANLFGEKRELKEPKFIKDFSKENSQLHTLESLSARLKEGWKKGTIDRDARYLKWGIEGESTVAFELKNSFIPMLCLHDIRLEYKDYAAQFDFILITNKFICVVETKQLVGNMRITADGEFIRQYSTREEGMYSPITQNDRHCNILREILTQNKKIVNMPILSMVVLANAKTVLDKSAAPSTVSEKIYRVDQMVQYLKEQLNDRTNKMNMPEKDMYEVANFIVGLHKPVVFNNVAKYSLQPEDYIEIKKDKETLYNELKEYRLNKSREENIKAYLIYNNMEMEDMIEKYPKTKTELQDCKGFTGVKVAKYGEDILSIFRVTGGSCLE